MMSEMDDLREKQLEALSFIIFQKLRVVKIYNKKVKAKSFQKGELV